MANGQQYPCDKCSVIFSFPEGLHEHKVNNCPPGSVRIDWSTDNNQGMDSDSVVEPMELSTDESLEGYYVPDLRDIAHMESYEVEQEYDMCDDAWNCGPAAGRSSGSSVDLVSSREPGFPMVRDEDVETSTSADEEHVSEEEAWSHLYDILNNTMPWEESSHSSICGVSLAPSSPSEDSNVQSQSIQHSDANDEASTTPATPATEVSGVQEEQGEIAAWEMEVEKVSPHHFFENIWTSGQLQWRNFTQDEHQELFNIIQKHLHSPTPLDSPYLLLENNTRKEAASTQCFMNTIINLLYSCLDFRWLIQSLDESQTILTSIFSGMINSGRLWRYTLPRRYHTNQQDIHTIFEMLTEGLRVLPIQMIQCKTHTESRCLQCQETSIRRQRIEESTSLKIENGSFSKSLQSVYSPKPETKVCKCGGALLRSRKLQPLGRYLILLTQFSKCTRIQDLTWNSVYTMFGSTWKVRSVAQRMELVGDGGHFIAHVRLGDLNGDQVVRISDSKARANCVDLAEIDIKIIVFEKV